ncbi:unnamed protein product [Mytilus coruscus]|uniref:Uncharacterized protein n=1 Tax=Mytilus coruscus TaxID=42192 RepID=A0A6J8CI56_MYTCO|nr:unnamed protein product [Mytilus coruscus]
MSGVLESAWCLEKLRIPMKLHELLDHLESSHSGNGSKEMTVEGWFDINYGSEYDSQYDDFMANRTAHNYTTYLNMDYKYCQSMFPSEYHVNAYIGMSIFLSGMLSGIVQKYGSSRLTQSASQRSQSSIASIVIALYFTFYCPLKIVGLFLQFACVDPKYVGPISFTVSMAQFLLNAFNPIILCLRVPEAKKALVDRCCPCIGKHQNNQK